MTYTKDEKSYDAYSNIYWIPTILDIETLHYVLTDKSSDVRVKYLDEQDILDLGFEYTNNDLDLIKEQDNKTIRIRYRVIDDEPHLRIYEKSNRSYKDGWLPIFLGKIKNNNEFKKLLTQLEIIIQ